MTPAGRTAAGEILPALWIGEGCETVLYTAEKDDGTGADLLLWLCEDICRAVGDNKPLEGLDLRGVLTERRLVILPLAGDGQEAAVRLCRGTVFRSVISLRAGECAIRWQGGARTPVHARMMAAVLSASGDIPLSDTPPDGFAGRFLQTCGRPAFAVGIPPGREYAALREMLLLGILL